MLAAIISPFAVGSLSAFAHTEKPHSAKETISKAQHPCGQEGDPKKISRTISISINDNMQFTPDTINLSQGKTIRFVAKNAGKMPHEMVVGSNEGLAKHAALMKKHPNMEHDERFMAHVASGKQTDIV